jgi:ApbE superfamily uncharacterized protein (UPF0280 family)
MTRARVAMLPDGRRLHLQDGPIDLVIEAFGSPEAVRAAYAAAIARFDGLLDELCAELPALRSPVRGEGTALAGPVALRMYAAVAEHAAGTSEVGATTDVPATLDGAAVPFSCLREKGPEGRLRARPAEPGGEARPSPRRIPTPCGRRPSSGAARHRLPAALGEGKPDIAPFITPMAAVAGAVADAVLAAMLVAAKDAATPFTRAYVNNGGDIALFLAPGERFRIGLVDRPDRPSLDASALFARTELSPEDGVSGIATSGWRGRSFSLGIADAVTVLARTAAAADAAATVIANAVDLPGHPAIVRVPACEVQPDSDLGDRRVTRDVGALSADEIDTALSAGVAVAEGLVRRGLIAGAALHLAGATRVVGIRLAGVVGRGDGGDCAAAAAVHGAPACRRRGPRRLRRSRPGSRARLPVGPRRLRRRRRRLFRAAA